MGIILTGDWHKALSTTQRMALNAERASDRAVRDEAIGYLQAVNKAFVKRGYPGTPKWPKLSRITLELRRNSGKFGGLSTKGTKPLIRSGGMRMSLNIQQVDTGRYFVGIHRSARGARGAPLVNIGSVHERSLVFIPITDKMRRYFMYLYMQGALKKFWPPPSKKYIVIRQRSFLSETMKEYRKGIEKRVYARWVNYLHGGKKLKLSLK